MVRISSMLLYFLLFISNQMNFSGLELFADVRKGTMSPNDQKKGKLLQKDITLCSHTVIPI